MKTIFCISGMGADDRAFAHIRVPGHRLRVIQWKEPLRGETLEAYAQRMAAEIEEPQPVLMGLSFGGMMCIEIAKLIPVSKVILISSIKSVAELPSWMRLVGRLRLDKVVPLRSFKLLEPLQNYKLGVTNEAERRMALDYRRNANRRYINWAVNQILNWRNQWQPGQLYHIHGTRDRMFPIRRIGAAHLVQGGGHLMIMNRADEINRYLQSVLT
jgi:pimeloyl-ACP methyl ester carboxylesterase